MLPMTTSHPLTSRTCLKSLWNKTKSHKKKKMLSYTTLSRSQDDRYIFIV